MDLTPRTLTEPNPVPAAARARPRRRRWPAALVLALVLIGGAVILFEGLSNATVYFCNANEVGQRSETVRRSNLSAIVRELHARGTLSRSELVARTGLTRSAIRGLIGELVAASLVSEERGTPQGTPGRPSPLVSPDPACGIVLALEITVDSLAVAAVACRRARRCTGSPPARRPS